LQNVDFKQWNIHGNVDSALDFLSHVANYDPSLYLKLAESLKSRGSYATAREIIFAKRLKDYEVSDRLEKGLNWISWALVGYGVKPEIGLLWFLILFAAGYIAFRSGERRLPAATVPRSWFAFTIDTIIPILSLDEAHDKISFPDWRQGLLYVMKISSILLAYLLFKTLEQALTGG
jgi:hypothetical protein